MLCWQKLKSDFGQIVGWTGWSQQSSIIRRMKICPNT